MEDMMKKICEGTRQRDEVVQASLEMYREMYMKARQQSQVLKSVREPSTCKHSMLLTSYLLVCTDCGQVPPKCVMVYVIQKLLYNYKTSLRLGKISISAFSLKISNLFV